jgi:hypothetical protein
MQLKLYLPTGDLGFDSEDQQLVVRTEADIRTAGFAVARAVRDWLRKMPFVPSQSDLHWRVYAEVVADAVKPPKVDVEKLDAPPKRKRKKEK